MIDDCWYFAGTIDGQGYGRIKTTRERSAEAHRVLYEIWVSEVPEGLVLDHLCRIRHCVNPAHLEPVTIKENILRGRAARLGSRTSTHCTGGHRYVEGSFYIRNDNGSRRCRECENRRHALRLRRLKLREAR